MNRSRWFDNSLVLSCSRKNHERTQLKGGRLRTSGKSRQRSNLLRKTVEPPKPIDTCHLLQSLLHDTDNLFFPLRAHLNLIRSRIGTSQSNRSMRSLRAINDTLAFVRSLINYSCAAVHYSNNPEPATDFHRWSKSCGDLLRATLPSNMRLSIIRTRILPCIGIDSVRFTQAMLNLIGNTGAAMIINDIPNGCIRIEAKLLHASRPGDGIQVNIRDNAGGMSQRVLKSAFKRRVTTKTDGTGGLGLQIVNEIVREARGTVEVNSTPGVGTCISLLLPIATHTHTHTHKPGMAIQDGLHSLNERSRHQRKGH